MANCFFEDLKATSVGLENGKARQVLNLLDIDSKRNILDMAALLKRLKTSSKPSSNSPVASALPQASTDDFGFQEIKYLSLGLPSEPSLHNFATFAYDITQSILAVGCVSGHVSVFGHQGIETSLPPYSKDQTVENVHNSNPSLSSNLSLSSGGGQVVKFLEFKLGTRYLVAVTARNLLTIFNLVAGLAESSVDHTLGKNGISSLAVPPANKLIYLGLTNGSILVVSIENNLRETLQFYGYIPSHLEVDVDYAQVTCLEFSPTNPNHLLIGYGNSIVVLYDINAKAPILRFQQKSVQALLNLTTKDPLSLGVIEWLPSGSSCALDFSLSFILRR